MVVVRWLKERNGQQQDGFMLSRSTEWLTRRLGVWTRMRAALSGQRQGSARRIQLTWWVQTLTMVIAERAAMFALLKK